MLIDELNVYDNLILSQKLLNLKDDKKVNSIIELLSLKFLLKKYPPVLSGGEKQRVAIARALINNPKILFCDEPTGSIDEENELIALKIIKELAREKLVIVVSHNVALFIKHCDKAYYMEEGELYD